MTEDQTAAQRAAVPYLFAFPLVFNLEQVERYVTTGVGSNPQAPFNALSHARTLASAKDTFVSINNDTVYSMAQLDLGVGPVRLSVPATGGRYHVLQFVSAWTDNFAYIGQRATGDDGGEYLLVPPGWQGDDEGLTVVRFPTRIASIVGRWAVSGTDDLPAVHALQDAVSLEQVNQTLAPAEGLPEVTTTGDEALDFFERFRVWAKAFPPAPRDEPVLASLAPLGLTGDTPVHELPEGQRHALAEAYAAGRATLEQVLTSGLAPKVNGWTASFHVFDYNLDYFEVGTIDSPEWKIADPTVRLVERAAAARAGLWGNHAYEAAYVMTFEDADGAQLAGEHRYRLRLSPPPPVEAFWSLTMYSLPEFYLVDNPTGRYSVGDRTPGIVTDDDGGVTITMSAAEPSDPHERANWLPAPAGAFRPILRMYVPDPAVVEGGYALPAIERIS